MISIIITLIFGAIVGAIVGAIIFFAGLCIGHSIASAKPEQEQE